MNASFRTINLAMATAGALLGGLLGETIGLRPALVMGAAVIFLAPVWLSLSPVRRVRDLPTRDAGGGEA